MRPRVGPVPAVGHLLLVGIVNGVRLGRVGFVAAHVILVVPA